MKVVFQSFACFAAVLLLAFSPAASALAQSSCSGDGYVHHGVIHGVHHNHSGYYGFSGYRPYAYDPGFGVAAVIHATAAANVLNADARMQHLHADRVQMENSVQFLATRLERKKINSQSRFGHLHARGEQFRQEKLAESAALATQPIRRCVDPTTGRVDWPILLRGSYFQKARGPIDQVFHDRSLNGSINPDHYLPMRDWIERIERELKANVAYYEMQDYLEAKSFLRNLIDEARVDDATEAAHTQLATR